MYKQNNWRRNHLASDIQLIGLLLSLRGWYDLRCTTSRRSLRVYTHVYTMI